MNDRRVTLTVDGSDWDSRQAYGPSGNIIGNQVGIGSVVELQLTALCRETILYDQTSRNGRVAGRIIEARRRLALDPAVGDKGQFLVPLGTRSTLVCFQGHVKTVRRASFELEGSKDYVNALVDCGVPIVLEDQVSSRRASVLSALKEQEILGICMLWGWVSSPDTIFEAPVKAKVLSVNRLNNPSGDVLLTIDPRPPTVQAERWLGYTLLSKNVANKVRIQDEFSVPEDSVA